MSNATVCLRLKVKSPHMGTFSLGQWEKQKFVHFPNISLSVKCPLLIIDQQASSELARNRFIITFHGALDSLLLLDSHRYQIQDCWLLRPPSNFLPPEASLWLCWFLLDSLAWTFCSCFSQSCVPEWVSGARRGPGGKAALRDGQSAAGLGSAQGCQPRCVGGGGGC